ncbi:MAG TPA: addiction module toxin, HicA family [Desulfobacterales bacterium]|nr:addiction module toxin, HicA family [Desulfobacterales bacterium]
MKRKEFIKQLERAGCVLARHGAKHDIYLNPKNGRKQPVPRHAELEEILV